MGDFVLLGQKKVGRASYMHMAVIDAFITFLVGLIYLFINVLKYILNFFLSLLNMI